MNVARTIRVMGMAIKGYMPRETEETNTQFYGAAVQTLQTHTVGYRYNTPLWCGRKRYIRFLYSVEKSVSLLRF